MIFIYTDFSNSMKVCEKKIGELIKNEYAKAANLKNAEIEKHRVHVFKVCLTKQKDLNTTDGDILNVGLREVIKFQEFR